MHDSPHTDDNDTASKHASHVAHSTSRPDPEVQTVHLGDVQPRPATLSHRGLTRRAEAALEEAARFARDCGSDSTYSVHVLTAVLADRENMAARMLQVLRVDIDLLEHQARHVSESLATHNAPAGDRPLAHVLRAAKLEANRLGHQFVGCEHLFLGVLAGGPDDVASLALMQHGVSLEAARHMLRG